MKTTASSVFGLSLLAGTLMLPGCSQQPEADDTHAGHPHGTLGKREAAATECAEHHAPRDLCFICDPALRDQGRLWCNGHDRYEDRCWFCHPELQDQKRLWCQEHSLFEDECFLCHPEMKEGSRAARGAGVMAPSPPVPPASALVCAEHGVPEEACGICHPELAAQLKPGQSVKVRLPAADSATMAGVRTGAASVGGLADGVECFADLAFNQNKLAQIVAPVGGLVQDVTVDLGSRVEEKETVAKIWSAAIAEAVAKAVLTHQTLDRERKLRAQRVTSERDLQQAEAEHRAACQQLRTLGFTEEQIEELGNKPQEQVLMEVRAPFAGEIVERTAVRGALVDAGKPLFTVADRSVMWAMLNIPEAALGRVRAGQTVALHVDSLPGQTFTGRLTWVGAEVNERSRMARARVEVPNPDGALRAGMFARARIETRNADGALVLPETAIQRVDGRPLVFVRLAEDLFEARAVRLGTKFDRRQEVLEGLKAEEPVVVAGAFPLKSQLLMSRLGVGCAHE